MVIVRPAPAVDEFVRVFEAAWVFGRHPERSAHAAALVGAEHRFGAPPDPVAGLGASEGGIYGRFGYGLATREIEPLQWMLPDPRAFAVTALYDHLWIRLVDVPAALSGRGHGAEGSLVLDVRSS